MVIVISMIHFHDFIFNYYSTFYFSTKINALWLFIHSTKYKATCTNSIQLHVQTAHSYMYKLHTDTYTNCT